MQVELSAADIDSSNDIEQRVRLINRLRKMLVIQREKFRSYLGVLEQQEDAIINANSEVLENQALIEQQIVRDILSIQKVITPLDTMYRRLYPNKKEDITRLQKSLSQLKEQVLVHNAHNRELLSRHRDELKKKIEALRLPKARKSVYARQASMSMVDISC